MKQEDADDVRGTSGYARLEEPAQKTVPPRSHSIADVCMQFLAMTL